MSPLPTTAVSQTRPNVDDSVTVIHGKKLSTVDSTTLGSTEAAAATAATVAGVASVTIDMASEMFSTISIYLCQSSNQPKAEASIAIVTSSFTRTRVSLSLRASSNYGRASDCRVDALRFTTFLQQQAVRSADATVCR